MNMKIGLEIHAQLEGKKLFCECPTALRDDQPEFTFVRHLHASAGETGEIDIAAQHEMLKEQFFQYEGYHDTTCLVEMDEEPPHGLDEDALTAALQVAGLLNMHVADGIQFMRKTVVDGSNTSGFQRTGLVGHDGVLPTENGIVRVASLCLEEDACKIIARRDGHTVYRLDRLGVPLVEIATYPDISSPRQAQEAAAFLGMVLRSTGRAKRGIGTIRQDVNVSVDGGNRVEVKGAQDLRMLPRLIEIEVQRQQLLNDLKKDVPKNVSGVVVDVTLLLKNSTSKVIELTLKKKGVVLAMKLTGFAGLLGRELQPGKRLGTEFSDRAKVRSGVGGLFHSDELPNYGITSSEVIMIKKDLECKGKDAFVLVCDMKKKATFALEAVLERAQMCSEGVVSEVRKANQDGTTSFMRPMPGGARMYPETDVGLVFPTAVELPELLASKATQLEEHHELSSDLAAKLTRIAKHGLFEEIANTTSVKPSFIAEVIVSGAKQIKKLYDKEVVLSDDDLKAVFVALSSGKIGKDVVLQVLADGVSTLDSIENVSDEDLEKCLKKIVSVHKDAPFSALMGEAMKEFRGRVDGKKISEILKRIV